MTWQGDEPAHGTRRRGEIEGGPGGAAPPPQRHRAVCGAARTGLGAWGQSPRTEILRIRVSKGTVEALEEYLETLRTQPPFVHMSRAEAIRWLIALGLERDRAEQAKRRDEGDRSRGPPPRPDSGR